MATPNTLTFALLGLLAEKPLSAYALNKRMQTSVMRGIWPSAASHTYAQIKQLVALGYAGVSAEATGSRARSVYRVTPAGRKALRRWLADKEAKPFGVESERLLKYLYNSGGDDEPLLRAFEGEIFETFRAISDTLDRLAAEQVDIVAPRRKAAVLNLLVDLRETCLAWSRDQLRQAETADDDDGGAEYARVRKRLDKHLSTYLKGGHDVNS